MRSTVTGRLTLAAATLAGASAVAGAVLAVARSCPDPALREGVLQGVSWLLVVGGVAGNFLAGDGRRWAWLVLFGLQPVWIAYALATGQVGFVLGSLAYAGAQLNGYLRGGNA